MWAYQNNNYDLQYILYVSGVLLALFHLLVITWCNWLHYYYSPSFTMISGKMWTLQTLEPFLCTVPVKMQLSYNKVLGWEWWAPISLVQRDYPAELTVAGEKTWTWWARQGIFTFTPLLPRVRIVLGNTVDAQQMLAKPKETHSQKVQEWRQEGLRIKKRDQGGDDGEC